MKKCLFIRPEVKFFGLIFGEEGIRPDPEKVKSLRDAETPKDKSEVRSFLGMTNFSARFIMNYSTLTHNLRELTKKDTPWEWREKHEKAFNVIIRRLSEDTVLNYFDLKLKTEIICDASPFGLSAILVQYEKSDGIRRENP